ncbi:MAG: DeoR/GlpR family DNA-binding transcription regulator, partial [Pseudomonadota bacterium]
MTPLNTRQLDILKQAREQGRVWVDDLVQQYAVTPQTVRRDLKLLCDLRHLARTHGGATLAGGSMNLGYGARRSLAQREKAAIGEHVAREVANGSSLFINLGTTTEAVAGALCEHSGLMVVTNNLNVANMLADGSDADVIVAGGQLRRSDGGLVGEATADFVRQFKVDIGIIGASAIDPDGSFLDYDYREVRVAQAIIANARRVFLVADHSKLARGAPVRIGHLADVDAFFTDAELSPALVADCRTWQTTVHICAAAHTEPR